MTQRRAAFAGHHPALWNGGDTPLRPVKPSDAQFVIAREIGLPSWPKLKAHILTMRGMRDRIAHGTSAPDANVATLHIRCGSDIKSRLTEAGFIGDFLEYSDALCQGPIIDDPPWLDQRAAFLGDAYGPGVGRTRQQIAEGLARAEAELQVAASRYDRVVLWFEHDGYDQINLSRCLAQFAETPPRRLEMVTLDHYPGAMRFIGLGQLPPEALRLLWDKRTPVTAHCLDVAAATDPTPLAAAVAAEFPELPYLAPALPGTALDRRWSQPDPEADP